MARKTLALVIGATLLAGAALAADPRPAALANAPAGLWEIVGAPGGKAPRRECVRDVSLLAQYEHRGHSCRRTIVSEQGNSAVIDYSCGDGGFGRSKVTAITPRSLRIETQGISDQLPFNYVLQARRVGECPAEASAARH
jgi:hypothetical protein